MMQDLRFGRSVTVVHRRDALRASKIMQERAFANPSIGFLWDSEVAEILGLASKERSLSGSWHDATFVKA